MTKIGYSSLSEVWGNNYESSENTLNNHNNTKSYTEKVQNIENNGINYTGGFNYNSSIKPLSTDIYQSNPNDSNNTNNMNDVHNTHIYNENNKISMRNNSNIVNANYENLKEYASNKIKSFECDALLEHLENCEYCRQEVKTKYLDKLCKIYKINSFNNNLPNTEHFSGGLINNKNDNIPNNNSKIKMDQLDIIIIALSGIFIIYVLDSMFKLGKSRAH